MNKPEIFKTGSTFDWGFRLFDPDTKESIPITPDMTFASSLMTASGSFIANLEPVPFDQNTNPGCVKLTYSGSTSHWPVGTAVTDVKVMIGGAIRYTGTQSFPIQKSITP